MANRGNKVKVVFHEKFKCSDYALRDSGLPAWSGRTLPPSLANARERAFRVFTPVRTAGAVERGLFRTSICRTGRKGVPAAAVDDKKVHVGKESEVYECLNH
jgi:hypothetical protein